MTDRAAAIRKIAVGDIVHAAGGGFSSLICLVTSVTEQTIHSRTVTHQLLFDFDRRTGVAEWGEQRVICTIDSTAPLPPEIKDVMLGLDRKFRGRPGPEDARLTDAEIRAFVFLTSFYADHRLD